MSKVNVDEIQVGDLVEMPWGNEKWLCYITKIELDNNRFYGYWSDTFTEDWDKLSDLTGHWKVINFEEESKMNDELKVYTGKETLQALLEGKILKRQDTKGEYRFNDGQLQFYTNGKFCKIDTSFTDVYNVKFTEVVTPQVGDWVKVTIETGKVHVGKLINIDSGGATAFWNNDTVRGYLSFCFEKRTWEILSPEQVTEYKRELAFSKVGRKLNEFKSEDIVYVESLEKVMIVISKINTDKVMLRDINYTGSGRHAARPHQLTPISFVENQVDLS